MAAKTIDQQVQDAVLQARQACQTSGDFSSECAVAWDIVEELRAAVAHRRGLTTAESPLEHYCHDHPDASECRIYDV